MALNSLYRKELVDLEEWCTREGCALRNETLFDFLWFITCDVTKILVREFDLRDYHQFRLQGGWKSLTAWLGGIDRSAIQTERSMIMWRNQPVIAALVNELWNHRFSRTVAFIDRSCLLQLNKDQRFPNWYVKFHVFTNVYPGMMTHRGCVEFSADSEEELVEKIKLRVSGWIAEFSIPSRVDPSKSNL